MSIYLKYVRNTCVERLSGAQDLSSEIFYWERTFHESKITTNLPPKFTPSNHCKECFKFAISELQKSFDDPLNCIEIGSGPVSQFYSEEILNIPKIRISALDPLADTYNELHKKYGSEYNIRCIRGFAENMNKLFPPNSFHLVFSQNAIDHSKSPIDFFDSICRILKPKGFIVLNGFLKVGTISHWMGLHQWDIEIDGNDLVVSNRDKSVDRYNFTSKHTLLAARLLVKQEGNEGMYTAIYQKVQE